MEAEALDTLVLYSESSQGYLETEIATSNSKYKTEFIIELFVFQFYLFKSKSYKSTRKTANI